MDGATYRTAYPYDYAERIATLATYATATPAITSWTYSDTTGWLQQKTYPDGSDPGTTPDPGPSYTSVLFFSFLLLRRFPIAI